MHCPATARSGTARSGTARSGTARSGTAGPGTAGPGTARPATARPSPGRARTRPPPTSPPRWCDMRRAVLAVAVLAALLLGGCGIPDNSDVQVLGAAPPAGPSSGDDSAPPVQFGRDATTDPSTFVDYYLQAAAGDPTDALTRVKGFLSAQAQAAFKPSSPGIKVIREVEK